MTLGHVLTDVAGACESNHDIFTDGSWGSGEDFSETNWLVYIWLTQI